MDAKLKFGQKDISNRIRVVDRETGNNLIKKYHCTYFSEVGEDKYLIKYSDKLNEKLRLLYTEEVNEKDKEYFVKSRGVATPAQLFKSHQE